MNFILKVNVDPAWIESLEKMPEAVMQAGATSLYNYLKEYHTKMDWKGPHWMPGPDSGQFARDVVQGWQKPQISGLTVVIRNTFGLLGWKMSGGTITPKTANFLTIPLVPGAKVVPARDFPGGLFRAGNALCRKVGQELEAIYALKKSVTQKPWPGAMPTDEQLAAAFIKGADSVTQWLAA
jgi:hypothetical protein